MSRHNFVDRALAALHAKFQGTSLRTELLNDLQRSTPLSGWPSSSCRNESSQLAPGIHLCRPLLKSAQYLQP